MKDSKIQWTTHTFNLVWGCSKVSAGCKNCYADTLSHRYGFDIWGKDKPRRTMSTSYWQQPYKWDKAAAQAGERHRVFCSSMADVFEDHPTVKQERPRLWKLIEETPNLDWLLLTKRPENIAETVPVAWLGSPRHNVWLGTSVEDQEMANKRIPELLKVSAVVRFLSCEPLLGPIHLCSPRLGGFIYGCLSAGISWVIVGGESGHGARPMNIAWAIDIIDQCRETGVPVFVKQLGVRPYAGENVDGEKHWLPVVGKGDAIDEWHPCLQYRQFPKARLEAPAS